MGGALVLCVFSILWARFLDQYPQLLSVSSDKSHHHIHWILVKVRRNHSFEELDIHHLVCHDGYTPYPSECRLVLASWNPK